MNQDAGAMAIIRSYAIGRNMCYVIVGLTVQLQAYLLSWTVKTLAYAVFCQIFHADMSLHSQFFFGIYQASLTFCLLGQT